MRPATLLLLALAAGAIGALILVNREVSTLDQRLGALNERIEADYRALHVLRAEYGHLTQPARLEALAAAYLDLAPLQGAQLVRLGPGRGALPSVTVMRDGAPNAVMPVPGRRDRPARDDAAAAPVPAPRATVAVHQLPATAGRRDARRPIDTVVDLMADLFALADYGRR